LLQIQASQGQTGTVASFGVEEPPHHLGQQFGIAGLIGLVQKRLGFRTVGQLVLFERLGGDRIEQPQSLSLDARQHIAITAHEEVVLVHDWFVFRPLRRIARQQPSQIGQRVVVPLLADRFARLTEVLQKRATVGIGHLEQSQRPAAEGIVILSKQKRSR